MSGEVERTPRANLVAAGHLPEQSFDEWLAELRRLAAEFYDNVKPEDWRGYYDDAYSPKDALHEDLSYD